MINKDKTNTKKLLDQLKNTGLRLTGTRKTILDIIISTKKGLSAEEIFIAARKKDPSIGIATIYRNIRMLEELEIIEKTVTAENKNCYFLSGGIGNIKNNHFKKPVLQKGRPEKAGVYVSSLPDGQSSRIDAGSFSFYDSGKIDRMQSQLNEWMSELDKIRREKEFKVEEVINDVGKIDEVLQKHQYQSTNLIQMLLDFQGQYNWLPKHVLLYVSTKLKVPLTQVYGIASFYKFFNLEPRGKYQVLVCAGTACHVRGSVSLLQKITNVLKINPGDTTPDYKFTLDTVNCLGCCALGPVMMFNNKYYSNPSRKELEKLFASVA
jgi:NADH-quinone oxidoreductase subunit E